MFGCFYHAMVLWRMHFFYYFKNLLGNFRGFLFGILGIYLTIFRDLYEILGGGAFFIGM